MTALAFVGRPPGFTAREVRPFDRVAHIEQREARWQAFLADLAAGPGFEFVGWLLSHRRGQPLTIFAGFVRARHRNAAPGPWWFAGHVGELSDGPGPWRERTRGRAGAVRGPLSILSHFRCKPGSRALLELQSRATELGAQLHDQGGAG